MRRRLNLLPTPMAGLALAIASLGWCWENVGQLYGIAQISGAVLAGIMLAMIASKFLINPKSLWADLQHPVVGSVVPTFAMGLMIVSNTLGKLSASLGDGLWLFAISLHLCFLVSFVFHRARDFSLSHMVPSWFVPPVGLVVADVGVFRKSSTSPDCRCFINLWFSCLCGDVAFDDLSFDFFR